MEFGDKIESMEFEEALKELEDIVKQLEEGKTTLKESVSLYERGHLLKKHCDKILDSVQLKLNQISIDKNGNVNLEEKNTEF